MTSSNKQELPLMANYLLNMNVEILRTNYENERNDESSNLAYEKYQQFNATT